MRVSWLVVQGDHVCLDWLVGFVKRLHGKLGIGSRHMEAESGFNYVSPTQHVVKLAAFFTLVVSDAV
jgi:hypothetical protein